MKNGHTQLIIHILSFLSFIVANVVAMMMYFENLGEIIYIIYVDKFMFIQKI